ncbi:MAG: SURF1 family protein [Alphaproteobacteria bacterium]|nr:SURF1 family protein [Alphaproteobacteria bacterium]
MSGKRRLWPVLLASTLGFVFLCGLGVWQVERLGQKEALIATLEARMAAAPVPLAEALQKFASGQDVEYLKVVASGELDAAHTLYKQTVFYGSAGWEGLAPYRTADGAEVLVDLGATDGQGLVPKAVPELVGVIRLHNKGRGFFDADNAPAKNEWFWWDVPAMQKAAGLKDGAAPIILEALGNESGFQAAPPKVELANNHLGYAITWFGLALALAGVTLAFVLKKADA